MTTKSVMGAFKVFIELIGEIKDRLDPETQIDLLRVNQVYMKMSKKL